MKLMNLDFGIKVSCLHSFSTYFKIMYCRCPLMCICMDTILLGGPLVSLTTQNKRERETTKAKTEQLRRNHKTAHFFSGMGFAK